MLRALRRLLPYVARARTSYLIGLICTVAATAVSLASPWVLKYVVDGLTAGIDRLRLALLAALIVALAVVDGLLRYTTRMQVIGASRRIEYDLRHDFFGHLQRLPLQYFQTNRTGDLMSRATNDLGAVRMLVGPALMYSTSTGLAFVVAVSVMFWIDVRLTLLALLPLPGVTLATRYFGRAIHDRFERIQAQLSEMSAVVQESLAGVRVVRAFGQEPAEEARFETENDTYVRRSRRLIRLQSAFYPSLTLCFGLSGLLVIWVGGREVMAGQLTLGEFVAFSRYLVLLAWPMIAFGWVINLGQRGVASWERMLEVLDAPEAAPDAHVRTWPAAPAVGQLEIRHLNFRYPGAPADTLTDVSLAVHPGRTVALVGATGSGKTTIVTLLTRLYDPPPGTVFLDGHDARDVPVDWVREAVAVVPQEPYLFSDTVGGNVAFALDRQASDARTAEIAASGSAAGLDADVAEFPSGYDTIVGERGITLSGGQKQRVALARALATGARILVLDDALSAVDTATEEAILGKLRSVRRDRACLIIAHRVSTVRDADEILVLDDGRVAERGTHDELVALGGRYADLHQQQLLEEEIEAS